jgi:hypothetical protein
MNYRVIIVFLISMVIYNSCILSDDRKGGGFTEVCSYTSEISKELGVFISYYDMLSPFEYMDSIFYVKLAFNEVFTETTYTGRREIVPRYDSAGVPFFRQSLVAVIDTSISKIEYFKEEDYASKYPKLKFDHGWNHLQYKNAILVDQLFYKEPVLSPPYYEGCGGIPDTLKIEVSAYTTYKKICGIPDSVNVIFGEVVFIKRKDTIQSKILDNNINKKSKKLPIIPKEANYIAHD